MTTVNDDDAVEAFKVYDAMQASRATDYAVEHGECRQKRVENCVQAAVATGMRPLSG